MMVTEPHMMLDVTAWAPSGDGSPETPWAGWEQALLDAYGPVLPANYGLYFPVGDYTQAIPLVSANGWTVGPRSDG